MSKPEQRMVKVYGIQNAKGQWISNDGTLPPTFTADSNDAQQLDETEAAEEMECYRRNEMAEGLRVVFMFEFSAKQLKGQ